MKKCTLLFVLMLCIVCGALAEEVMPVFANTGEAWDAAVSSGRSSLIKLDEGYAGMGVNRDGKYYRVVTIFDEQTEKMFNDAMSVTDPAKAGIAYDAFYAYLKTLPVSYVEEFVSRPMNQAEMDALYDVSVSDLVKSGFEFMEFGTISNEYYYGLAMSLGFYAYDVYLDAERQAFRDAERPFIMDAKETNGFADFRVRDVRLHGFADKACDIAYPADSFVNAFSVVADLSDTDDSTGAEVVSLQSVVIGDETFPDPVFQDYVRFFDKDGNGILDSQELKAVWEIDVSKKGVSSLQGLEYFPELENLNCYSNKLKSLDLSGCPKLVYLNFENNELTELDLSMCPELETIEGLSNYLTSLDLSNCLKLRRVCCNANRFKSIDVSMLPRLEELACGGSSLKELDVSHNPVLRELQCYSTRIQELDLSQNTRLAKLVCFSTNIRHLDVSMLPELWHLEIGQGRLETLNISQNPGLRHLSCGSNRLSALDVTHCPNLEYLYLADNHLKNIDLSQNPKLTHLCLNRNNLSSLDISHNPALIHVDIEKNKIAVIDVSQCPKIAKAVRESDPGAVNIGGYDPGRYGWQLDGSGTLFIDKTTKVITE